MKVKNLTEREQLVFDLLKAKRRRPVESDLIMELLDSEGLPLTRHKSTNSLTVMMKYLTAKVCEYGWIITRVEGGRGMGNKLVYSMDKMF